MKSLCRILTLLVLLGSPGYLLSQSPAFKLICPLDQATVVPPAQNAMRYDVPDLCIVLVSVPDTVVKAVGTGRITNVEYTEESGNGVVLFTRLDGKDYYFWYTGLKKVIVRRNDVIKIGQPLGYINPGERIELSMYEFETPLDPLKYLPCPKVLRGF
jgi:hypothetical protein